MVMLPATVTSCPAELRVETITGNVSLTSAYGKTSTRKDTPGVVPTVTFRSPPTPKVSAAAASSCLLTCPADGAGALQALVTSALRTSANKSFIRFTEISPWNKSEWVIEVVGSVRVGIEAEERSDGGQTFRGQAVRANRGHVDDLVADLQGRR